MKKFLIAFLAILMICMFSVSVFAAEENYVYTIGNVTIIFNENDTWDSATREIIAKRLVYGNDDVATYNLLCTIFGHKYETKSITAVTHCALDEAPRCLEEYFDLSLCSRCDDQLVERTAYRYIYCCP